jgi:hypothetical protein
MSKKKIRSNHMEYVLPKMVQKTMGLHMLLNFETTTIAFTSFDFWMSKNGVETFALVINYFDES